MSKKKILIIATIIIVGILALGLSSRTSKELVNPKVPVPAETPSPVTTPPAVPKTFHFDSSTDLEAEWEKVNPQVLDSDFE